MFDKNDIQGQEQNSSIARKLPQWDLSDLYHSIGDEAIERDLTNLRRQAEDFKTRLSGNLNELAPDQLARSIVDYERISAHLARILCYAHLSYASEQTDPQMGRFFQHCREKSTEISTHLLFFKLELADLPEETLRQGRIKSQEIAKYMPWLRRVRAWKPHKLSEDLEQLLHDKRVVCRTSWHRLFDETIATFNVDVGDKSVGLTNALDLMSSADQEIRQTAAQAVGRGLRDKLPLLTLSMNCLIKDKAIDDKWRGFDRPDAERNVLNDVDDAVIDALVKSVRDSYPSLSHRYYAMKADILGQEKLNFWDRMAPLPGENQNTSIAWSQAKDVVLDAYRGFSKEMAKEGERFFNYNWIDAGVRPGKAPGGFCHPTIPDVHPYILLNYQGRIRDVTTLAHELGHGIHQRLASKQGYLLSETPLTLAETASVFGEMLTFRHILRETTDPIQRRNLLASKIEDMLGTVVRQISFYDFEWKLHMARREQGELTSEKICELWLKTQQESLGPSVELTEDYGPYWSYVPHFVHSPFYVYSYAFGECLTAALYHVYRERPEGFAEKYVAMLAEGGRLSLKDILRPFDLDATDPDFWKRGLGVIGSLIDELENLMKDKNVRIENDR